MELTTTVQDQLNFLIENGAVEKIIKTQLEDTIKSIFRDTLREYSEFGKQLKEKIGEALKIDFNKFSLLDYNHIVTTVIKEELDKTLLSSVSEPIAEAIKGYTGELKKKEWKLSEVVKEFMSGIEKEDSSGEITLEIERSSYGYMHIYLDKESNKKNYNCEYQFAINKDGVIYTFSAGSYHPHKGDLRRSSLHGNFDKFLFKLYAMECKIEVDENNCETAWYTD